MPTVNRAYSHNDLLRPIEERNSPHKTHAYEKKNPRGHIKECHQSDILLTPILILIPILWSQDQ